MIKCTWIKDLIEDKQIQLKDQFNEENNLAIKIFFFFFALLKNIHIFYDGNG